MNFIIVWLLVLLLDEALSGKHNNGLVQEVIKEKILRFTDDFFRILQPSLFVSSLLQLIDRLSKSPECLFASIDGFECLVLF